MSASTHLPHNCTYLGRDVRGNYRFSCPSGSDPDVTHGCTIWKDGSSGVCSCQAYARRGTCGLLEARRRLILMARALELATELTDLAAGIKYNDMEGINGLDQATEARIADLEAQAADVLAELGPGQ